MAGTHSTDTFKSQIRRDIEEKIISGKWPPGFRIGSEHELMAQYGCSRMTVNKVMSALAESGLVDRRRKAGTFVARPHPRIESVAMDIPDIPVEVALRGHVYGYRRLARRKRAAKKSIPYEIELENKGEIVVMQGLHEADGNPFAYEDRLISLRMVPDAMTNTFDGMPPGSWLLQHIPWSRAEHRITAINADERLAGHLQVDQGTACLVLERRTWLGNQAITYAKQVFAGDSYELLARFGPKAEPAKARKANASRKA